MAQLELSVVLNLANFRTQLGKLAQASAAYYYPINLTIDKQAFRKQLVALGNIKTTLKINDSQVDGARERIGELNKSLATLRRATSTAIVIKTRYKATGDVPAARTQAKKAVTVAVRGQDLVDTSSYAELQKLYKFADAAGLQFERLKRGAASSAADLKRVIGPAFRDVGSSVLTGIKTGLANADSQLAKIAQDMGAVLISKTKNTLGIKSPSQEFRKIGEAVGQGFEQGLSSSMADAFDSLERQLGAKLQRLKAQAIAGTSGALAVSGRVSPVQVADVTPRDYARIAGSGSRAALPPGVDRSAATTQEFLTVMDRIGLAMANFTDTVEATTATMQGLKKVIAALNNRALLSGHEQYRLFAQSLTKGQLPLLAGAASQQLPMLKAAGTAPRADALRPQDRLLRDFLARTTRLLLPQGPGASGGRSVFSGEQFRQIAGSLRRPQIGPGTDLTVKSIAVKDLTGLSEGIKKPLTPLLPPAGGTTVGSRMRQQLSSLPALTAPSIGQENAPLSVAATRSLNKARQLLGMPIGPSSPLGSMGQFPMSGMIGRGSLGQFPMDRQLAVGGASAMGQNIAGPYPFSNTARSARGGYIPGIRSSAFFPMEGIMGPSSPLGRITPQSSMFGGGGPPGGPPGPPTGGGGGGSFGGMQFNVPKLPGAGLVREIGEEFGFAAKQVLLYGGAYKALAIVQSFPAQVGEAVGALQSFRNTIKEISPSAEEAASSSQFILDIVDKYNTPLQSARDGFVKLYASMQPAGFSGDEIRDLFLGISQTAATFGMSAEKVDRVNYAFAQMASKGQVMSEELKGQLGDVLPGAMAIFAEAAGFKGPEAITKFSKALEDGAYKGGAMKTLLTNVGSIMRKEFGPGAEGAARTFQGVMNRMQNSTKLLYEAFEPAAVGFLNSVVMPLTSGLKTVTDGFNAFFTGTNAKTAGGFAFAQELEKLKPTFEGIRANVTALMPTLQSFASTLLGIGKVFLQIAGNPFIGYLGRVYLNVLALTTAINILNLRALIPMIANFIRSAYSLIVFTTQVIRAAFATGSFGTAVSTAGLMLRTFFASTGVGLILVGISLLIERFMSMNQALADTRAKALGAATAIRAMSQTEAVLEERKANSGIKLIERLQSRKPSYEGSEDVSLTESEASSLEALGIPVNKGVGGGRYMNQSKLEGHRQNLETVNVAELRHRQRVIKDEENKAQQAAVIAPIPPDTGEEDPKAKAAREKAAREAEKLASQNQQRAIDLATLNNNLDKSRFDGLAALSEQNFEYAKRFIEEKNKFELFGLNDIEARQKKFQQELQAIQLKRIKAVGDAERDIARAELDFNSAQNTAAAAGAGAPLAPALPPPSGAGATRLRGSISGRLDASGQNGADMPVGSNNAIQSYHNGLVKAIGTAGKNGNYIVIDFIDDLGNRLEATYSHVAASVRQGQSVVGGQTIGRFDASGNTQGAHNSVDINSLGNDGSFQRNRETSAARRSADILATGRVQGSGRLSDSGRSQAASGSVFSMETRQVKAGTGLAVESQDRQNKIAQARLAIQQYTVLALKENANALAANKEQLFPVAQLQLENKLRVIRNQLLLQGMPEEYIAYQEELNKKTYESNIAIKGYTEENTKLAAAIKPLQDLQGQGAKLLPSQSELIRVNTGLIQQNKDAITELTETQKAYNIAALESAIASIKNADALKAQQDAIALIDGNVESATGSYKNFMKEVAQGGNAKEALKKFQESITDQVLTVFLDYSFKPVEEFFKNSLKNMFGLPDAEKAKQDQLAKMEAQMEAQLAEQKRITVATEKTAANTTPGAGTNAGTTAGAFPIAEPGGMVASMVETAMNGAALPFDAAGLSDASNAVGTWGDSLNTQLSESLTTATATTKKEGSTFSESLGKTVGAIGIAAGSIMGIAAGIGQIKEGGTSNVLGGIGSVLMSLGGAVGGFAGMFKGANGGVAGGGWKPFPVTAFANGGMVNGPTLGLVGEGKYNEAIVPLPDGRSIPVQMKGGGGGLREAMSGGNGRASGSPILNMSFQSTNINGVEYVSRDQLEQAMAVTRRQAAKEGANRGMNMTLDNIQNSPSTRSRLGMGGR